MDGGTPVLRVLRYPEPFTATGPSELERTFAGVAPAGAEYGGRLRLLPFADGAVAVQTFYADSGTVAGVVAGWYDAVGVGAGVREALRGIGPAAPPLPRAGPAVVSLEAAREWFLLLDRARARGDWEAFGEAWDGLRASLGLQPGAAALPVDRPRPRD